MNILHCISWEIESFMPFIDVMFDCIVNLWYIDVSLRLFLDFQLISSSIAPYMGMNFLLCFIWEIELFMPFNVDFSFYIGNLRYLSGSFS